MSMTTKRVANGTFDVYWNGEMVDYQIVNGSLGLSGRDTPNVYGIVKPNGEIKWVGTLQAAKKMLAFTLKKKMEQ